MILSRSFFVGCSLFLLFSCAKKNENDAPASATGAPVVSVKYAQGFKATKVGNAKLVEVTYPFQGATSGYKYLLVQRDKEVPPHDADVKVIRIPLQSVVCTSTTHIPLLDYIGETDKLVGFPTLDYVSSAKMRKRIDEGKIVDLGVDKSLNIERLAVLKPELVMGYMLSSDYGQFKKIEELGMPVVLNAEYLEKSPLGRAEWIKYVALFFNKEAQADSVFNEIEKEYNSTKQLASDIQERPTVLTGIVYGDGWFLPGGKNYAAEILKDAGCRYLWEDDSSHGYLQLSFEAVYQKARDAKLWIGIGSYKSLQELKDADQRYGGFAAYKTGSVYGSEARMGVKGGNELLELGYLRPDIILKDLVKIAHPSLMPSYELYFHQKIQ